MPALSAAAMIIEFFGTCIGLPSISMLTRSGAVGTVGCALMRTLLPAPPSSFPRKRTAKAGCRSEHSRSEWPEGRAADAASHPHVHLSTLRFLRAAGGQETECLG